ncbi:MAG: cytochrome c peroxidase [Chitinophagales bacterium]
MVVLEIEVSCIELSLYSVTILRSGRMKDVEEQAGGPILNPVEMAIPSQEFLMNRLKDIELYQKNIYAPAYPNEGGLLLTRMCNMPLLVLKGNC